MSNYIVYQKHTNNLYWVKTFYESNYKNERGAYKAANRYAKQMKEKTGGMFYVFKEED